MLEHLVRHDHRTSLWPAQPPMLRRRRPPPPTGPETDAPGQIFPVYLVECDPGRRAALSRDLRAAGFEVRAFDGLDDLLAASGALDPGCVLLDVAALRPEGLSIAEQADYSAAGCPTILMFGALDTDDAVRAVRFGAADLLRRPVSLDEVVAALRRVGGTIGAQRTRIASLRALRGADRLSPRERDVMRHLVQGLSSKQIARQIGLSHRTVEMHRMRLLRKLGVSIAELLGIAWRALGLEGL